VKRRPAKYTCHVAPAGDEWRLSIDAIPPWRNEAAMPPPFFMSKREYPNPETAARVGLQRRGWDLREFWIELDKTLQDLRGEK